MLQDLHSRNGTFVNRICLKPGAAVKLNAGDQLSFAPQEHTFADVDPPKMLAMHGPSRTVRVAESGLLALPSSERPEVTLFLDSEGTLMIERGRRLTARPSTEHRRERRALDALSASAGTFDQHRRRQLGVRADLLSF